MSGWDMQWTVVILLIAFAVGVIVRRLRRLLGRGGGATGCGSCASHQKSQPQRTFVEFPDASAKNVGTKPD